MKKAAIVEKKVKIPEGQLTRSQRYYKKKKATDPSFMKKRAKAQQKRYAENEQYREYQKAYHQGYHTIHKAELTQLHKLYPDPNVGDRVKKYWARQRETLSDKYIIQLLKRHKKAVTPKAIRERREKVIAYRNKKNKR